MSNIIEIKNVTYNYTEDEVEYTAVDNVSLNIEKGSFTVILGHNGSGKSTLAKMMNGLNKPTMGEILVNGMSTLDEENDLLIKRQVGMVFQNPDNQLVASIVEEDVAFGPENLGLSPMDIRERVDEALKSVGMYEFKNSTPHHLSGGQKQRIAIAGMIAMKPECLILDEPTAMLDPKGRAEIVNTILRLNKENGMTVVLITHYMEEAEKADRVLVMNDGKFIADGTPKEIFKNVALLKSVGLDVPQTTELLYELNNNGIKVPTDVLSIEETAKVIAAYLEEK